MFNFMDYPGNDLRGEHTTSIIDCYAKCLKEPDCACWTFYDHRQCYMKRDPCPAAKNISNMYVSGTKYCPFLRTGPKDCFLKNVDSPGFDIRGTGGIFNASDCHELCIRSPGCACWSYLDTITTCWLKYQCPEYKFSDNYTSGSVNCTYPDPKQNQNKVISESNNIINLD